MKSSYQRLSALAILWLGLASAATATEGVVLEEVGQGSTLERAGLRSGDLLVAWERSPEPPANPEGAAGELRTVFDWLWMKAEQAPRGPVRLQGERDGTAIFFEVPKGSWESRVRPQMTPDLLDVYMEGRRRLQAGDLEDGIALWEPLVQGGLGGLRHWILFATGEARAKEGQSAAARESWQAALAEARDAQARVAILEALGESYERANQLADAEASLRSALEVGEAAWGESLRVAGTTARLGNLLSLRNQFDEAAQLAARALEVRQRWAPDSLEVADSLIMLVRGEWRRANLDGMSAPALGALAILERESPDSLEVAVVLNFLGIVASERGHFDEAATALQRALKIQERLAPDDLQVARSLNNLGAVARLRGDAELAMELHERALAIWQKQAPDSAGFAINLANLGALARDSGDLAKAKGIYLRALAIWERTDPEGLLVAAANDGLGLVARLEGNLDEAWKHHNRSLEIYQRLAPDSLDMAVIFFRLGIVAEERGEVGKALSLYQRAQEGYQRLAPGTLDDARTRQRLGRLFGRTGRLDEASQWLARAVDSLESQVGRLGGSQDSQASYRARHEEVYRDAIEVELKRGHPAEAFHLLERSRARGFLALLSEREVTFGELPGALEASRRENAARYDKALSELARWTPAAGEEAREALHRELIRLRRERDETAAEIRKASPQVAALRQPQPLDLAAAREVLDPGTLALSYSIGDKESTLFALTRDGGLRVEALPIGEKRLREEVERFLEGVRQPTAVSGQGTGPKESPAGLARSLYRDLIEPIADLVERSERLLILPDGPLHRLPFAALIREGAGASPNRGQYLVEWKPLHGALSLTVYGALRASRRKERGPAQLVAFGDPRYAQRLAPDESAQGPVRRPSEWTMRGFHWAELPYSRREIERIAAVYPGARVYLGEEATEERAKSVAREARVLHFATHGYMDDRTPLDSAIVLTLPAELAAGKDNGLLQVWEIFESVRLDADLVVLSACDSALGRELSGEGLIGLTRAFQYAGARSVVASLWSVADQPTAELMARFHRHYAA
ncbi:MAG TPA: CHAT domain-containing protein, partial [Thermoanaerobaculia bacterium]|nr:CHAT domain-containing protein [Thermoanaerobaculia bacterium]